MNHETDMKKDLQRSLIVLVSLLAFEKLINAEDDDDIEWEKIDRLLLRYPRMVAIENEKRSSGESMKRELESKLNYLFEVNRRDLPYVRFNPAEKSNEEGEAETQDEGEAQEQTESQDETAAQDEDAAKDEETAKDEDATKDEDAAKEEDAAKDENAAKEENATKDEDATKDESVTEAKDASEKETTTKGTDKKKDEKKGEKAETDNLSPKEKLKKFHTDLIGKIKKKLPTKDTKMTISLFMGLIIMGVTILIACCCAVFIRNLLAGFFKNITGKNRKKSKMVHVDTERGRPGPKKRKKSIISAKKRARSLSLDYTREPIQKSATMVTEREDREPSTTGCYRCCKKKKKQEK